MYRIFAATMLALLVTVSAPADEPIREGDLVVERPWARASIGTSRPGAAYLTIRNEGAEADTLTGVEASIAGQAEVHHTTTDASGVTRMEPAGSLAIPAGEAVSLAPGGRHVMLMDLNEPLVEGKTLTLTLAFERSGEVAVSVPILGIGSRGPAQ